MVKIIRQYAPTNNAAKIGFETSIINRLDNTDELTTNKGNRSEGVFQNYGYIDVGHGCWRPNVLVTIWDIG